MKVYSMQEDEEIAAALTAMVERETGLTIFTMRVLKEVNDALEVLVIFEEKSVLMGLISIVDTDGKIGFRMQANFI